MAAKRRLGLSLFLCLAPVMGLAEGPVTVDPDRVLALAEEPWRDGRSFADALAAALGGFTPRWSDLPEAAMAEDPFLWSVMGSFGADVPGLTVSGGIVACSRYGLATRDRLAERTLSDPAVFAVFAATQAAPDDAAVWPDAAVARLSCAITWNDTRRVAILPEPWARAALAARFATVTRGSGADPVVAPRGGAPEPDGTDTYGLTGQGGWSTTIVAVESARIELRAAHQQIRFRSFLLNGGM